MDKISVKGLEIYAYHGVFDEEKRKGQNFILDIDAFVDISKACESDDVNDTVSYAQIIEETVRVFTQSKYNLLERASQQVARALFDRFDKIKSLRILLMKPDAPIDADFEYTGIEIYRNRGDFE